MPLPHLFRFGEPGSHQGNGPLWSRDGRESFLRDLSDDDGMMVSTPVNTDPTFAVGRVTRLFPTGRRTGFMMTTPQRNYDVAPDGLFVMMRQSGSLPPPVTEIRRVQHWYEELNRLVPADH